MDRSTRRCMNPPCKRPLDDGSSSCKRYPRCGHVLCQNCLSQADESSSANLSRTQISQQMRNTLDDVVCPICTHLIVQPKQPLERIQVLRKFDLMIEVFFFLGRWTCDECRRSEGSMLAKDAQFSCEDCDERFCDDCQKRHFSNSETAKSHRCCSRREFMDPKCKFGKLDEKIRELRKSVVCDCSDVNRDCSLRFRCPECNEEHCLMNERCKKDNMSVFHPLDMETKLQNVGTIVKSLKKRITDSVNEYEKSMACVREEVSKFLSKIDDLDESYRAYLQQFPGSSLAASPSETIDTRSDVETRQRVLIDKMEFAKAGLELLLNSVNEVEALDKDFTRFPVETLAFLLYNRQKIELNFWEDLKALQYFLDNTRLYFHKNGGEGMDADPPIPCIGFVQKKSTMRPLYEFQCIVPGQQHASLSGITVLPNNNIVVTDSADNTIACFEATEQQRERGRFLPTYEYAQKWSTKLAKKDTLCPGAIYVTQSSTWLAVIGKSAIHEIDVNTGTEKPKTMAPNMAMERTFNHPTERTTVKVQVQTNKNESYLASSIINSGLECGIVLPVFLNNVQVTPRFFFARNNKEAKKHLIVVSGTKHKEHLDEPTQHVVLFILNGEMKRKIRIDQDAVISVTFNTVDNCVYAADTKRNRIVVFNEYGELKEVFLDAFDGVEAPSAVAFDIQGRLLVAQKNGTVKVYPRKDELVSRKDEASAIPLTYSYFAPDIRSLPPTPGETVIFYTKNP